MTAYCTVIEKGNHLPTVISFSSINTPKGKFKPFKTVADAEVNVIFVNDANNGWYQNGIEGVGDTARDAALSLVATAKAIGNGRVVTFGTSMGAYGAMLYAALGGADGCLAFGVETKLQMRGSRSKVHIPAGTSIPYPDLRPILRDCKVPIFAYASEMDDMDLISINMLSDVPCISRFTVTGVGHPGVQAFDLDKSVSAGVTEFAKSGLPPRSLTREGRILEREELILELWDDYQARLSKIDNQEQLGRRQDMEKNWPDVAVVVARLGNALAKNGQQDAARDSWLKATSLCDYQYEVHEKLGELYISNAEYGKAIKHLSTAVEINPWLGAAHYKLGFAYKKVIKYDSAEKHFRAANSTSGGKLMYKKGLAEFLLQLAEVKASEARTIFESIERSQSAEKTAVLQ